ncbi:NAD(P)-dependent oxidoreductase [Nocardia macrotermitis]|uniref:NAD(P)-binding domain-containing protein n=1 Tax=Nocardia macrotermitis TaxID=2585198 RepID=A0A7K0D0B0_9NOCA|nr:NAD(P)H-binding protein [Nocardia macrotermitis]MQY19165.1 hypothetical protein [Nocardia macrotermitis]
MRIAVFGANGPTGRLLTDLALAAEHDVVAVTRRPDSFPLHHDRLTVAGADVLDQAALDPVLAGTDAVLSVLGVPFGRAPVVTYSHGIGNIIAAMRRQGVRRLVAVTSTAVDPHPYADAGFLFNRVLQPYVVNVLGKTVYDDMRRMEDLIRASTVEWTIVRPAGLYDRPDITAYHIAEGRAEGRFTARTDLAASLLALAGDVRYLRKAVGVITTVGNPGFFRLVRKEAFADR